jgi:hypothetical protein
MTSDCLPLQVLNVRLVDLASVFKTNHPPEESAALAQLTASLSASLRLRMISVHMYQPLNGAAVYERPPRLRSMLHTAGIAYLHREITAGDHSRAGIVTITHAITVRDPMQPGGRGAGAWQQTI